MDCLKIRKMFEEEMHDLVIKYKDQGCSEQALTQMLIENTNFVMASMIKEGIALSRGA